jgi:isochorismate synthase
VSNNNQAFYVNLRCMQITDNEAYLYVGGGITKDSIPEKEYEETQNKAMTMMTII